MSGEGWSARPCSGCGAERGEEHLDACEVWRRLAEVLLAQGHWWCACGSLRPPGEDPCEVCFDQRREGTAQPEAARSSIPIGQAVNLRTKGIDQ